MGLSTIEIAAQLHISNKTVETHRLRIKEKLEVETATQLVVLAVQYFGDSRASRRATSTRSRRSLRRPENLRLEHDEQPRSFADLLRSRRADRRQVLPGRAAQAGERKTRSGDRRERAAARARRKPGRRGVRSQRARANRTPAKLRGLSDLESLLRGRAARSRPAPAKRWRRRSIASSAAPPTLLVELSALLWKNGLHCAALELRRSARRARARGGLRAHLRPFARYLSQRVRSAPPPPPPPPPPPLALDSRLDDGGPDSRGSGRFEAASPVESISDRRRRSRLLVEPSALLEHFGYRVIGVAHSAEQALEAAMFDPPDLVILDIGLSGASTGSTS